MPPVTNVTIERALKRWFKAGVTPTQIYESISRVHPDCRATTEEIARASIHTNDECEIDGYPWASRGDDGCWVHAWVWNRYPEDDSEIDEANGRRFPED